MAANTTVYPTNAINIQQRLFNYLYIGVTMHRTHIASELITKFTQTFCDKYMVSLSEEIFGNFQQDTIADIRDIVCADVHFLI